MNVVVAGGGTAGHIEPALALADALRRRDPSVVVTALGTPRGLETRLVPARGYELDLIPPVPLPRRLTPALFAVPFRLVASVRAARRVLRARSADVVVGFGGYAALPAYLAARRRTPVVVHEANVRPGLANRVGARFAARVAVNYEGTPLRSAEVIGLPVRDAVASLDRVAARSRGAAAFGLDPALPTLLVFGGSQGARRVNAAVAGAAPTLVAAGIQVLHVTGTANHASVVSALAAGELPGDGTPYTAVPYVDRMELAYAAADLALCRAGAMTVAELTAVGLPAVFVPLPIGNGEQRLNAAPVVAAGGGLHVDDAALDAAWVGAQVPALLRDPARIAAMSAAARSLGRPGAADRLADLVVAAVRS